MSEISVPKGGGALAGIGETFQPDLHTGTGNLSVPIPVPPGRGALTPRLTLAYSSGSGNGPFGIGWSMAVPRISRRTERAVPSYDDRDVFVLSGAEELVPVPTGNVNTADLPPGASVTRYRPRTESGFARILHVDTPAGDTDYWEVWSGDGLRSRYGTRPATPQVAGWADPGTIRHPDTNRGVFAWLLTATWDSFGNLTRYDYVGDGGAQRYLRTVSYADYGDRADPKFAVTVTIQYSDDAQPRPDPFSDRRPGFELRTTRRATGIDVATVGSGGEPMTVVELEYADQTGEGPVSSMSLLNSIRVSGHAPGADPQWLPPLTFSYSDWDPAGCRYRTLPSTLPRTALGGPLAVADLFGDGLPSLLQLDDAPRYWRNRGGGAFERAHPLPTTPAGAMLGATGVALADVDADGRPELTITAGGATTIWPFAATTAASATAGFALRPTGVVNAATSLLTDPRAQTVDVDGDHLADLLITGDRPLWARADGHGRYTELHQLPDPPDPLRAARDPRVRLADMTGDGLTDVVMIEDGRVRYWPALGHGQYGSAVEMAASPLFPDAQIYGGTRLGPGRLLVGDTDGSGTADIVYVGARTVTVWVNQCGNSFAEPVVVPGPPRVTTETSTRLVDLLGAGVAGVLFSGLGTRHDWAFLDLTGGVKPYLLTGVDNHRGASTSMAWSTSTAFATADRTAGRPWRTPLPFPVHVLASTETREEFAGTVLTSAFRYHDGYWDPVDREFRGFGRVEQIDTLTPTLTRPAPATLTPIDSLTPRTTVPPELDAAAEGNLLRNWSFDQSRSGGPTELITPKPDDPAHHVWGGGDSAAAEWTTWNNTAGTTRTDLQPSTLPQGYQGQMLHVDTNGTGCGIVQTPFRDDIAPARVIASIWVNVVRGSIGLGTGTGGATGVDARVDATNVWTLVQVGNGRSPANEFVVYADADGGAEFYVDHAWITDTTSTPADPVATPPLRTVTWFHLGPVGTSVDDWTTVDPSGDYWHGDPLLSPQIDTSTIPGPRAGSPLLAQREAVRAARGHVLRTETYAEDGTVASDRPYEVHDTSVQIVPVLDDRAPTDPGWHAHPVTVAREVRTRTTSWDRGTDPLIRMQANGAYDEYNRPGAAVALGVPRGRDPRNAAGEPCLATVSYSRYATRDDDAVFRLDAIATSRRHQAVDPGNTTVVNFLETALGGHADGELRALECRYYDGDPFVGRDLGDIGDHALPVRTEQLVITSDQLQAVAAALPPGGSTTTPFPYLTIGGTPGGEPLWADYPTTFRAEVEGAPEVRGAHLGYVWHDADATFVAGYYAQTGRHSYDVQQPIPGQPPRGLLLTSRDAYGGDTTTSWDTEYTLLPVHVVDPNGLTTTGTWDTRLFKPAAVTDPNGNTTAVGYTPLGMPAWIARLGKRDNVAGDTVSEPGQRFSYDLTAYDNAPAPQPLSVTTVLRVDHRWTLVNEENVRRAAAGNPPLTPGEIVNMFGTTELTEHPERFIRTVEYSDGLGRLLQTRTQADDIAVTDIGLPADPSPAARTVSPDPPLADNQARVVVSGWKIYDNKGRPVRTYEPFFDADWPYRPPLPAELATLAAVTQHYDPRGRPTIMVAADGSQTRVVRGTPPDPKQPDSIDPNAWDTYTYDPNDNAGRTHPTLSLDYADHWNTPTSTHVDAFGRTIRTVQRGLADELVTTCTYDIDGHLNTLTDPMMRLSACHVYDCAGTSWASWLLDAGTVRTVYDAAGGVAERRDDKDALTLAVFDSGHRHTRMWGRDRKGLDLTLRAVTIYGDDTAATGVADPTAINILGRVAVVYDEAGRLSTRGYDIDGNATSTIRQIIDPKELVSRIPVTAADGAYPVDWQPDSTTTLAAHAVTLLDSTEYSTDVTFDALARRTSVTAPLDRTDKRAVIRLVYTRSGGLAGVKVDDKPTLRLVVYDPRGRRVLVQLGNGVIQRCRYDPKTLRLRRMHAQLATTADPFAWTTTGPVLQDHLYRCDVNGNLLVLGDRTPGSGLRIGLDPFHSPDENTLDRWFAYDPLDRLVSATGRESDAVPVPPWLDNPRSDDVTATRAYTETYAYDAVGNLTTLHHDDQTNTSRYTRTFTPVDASNRLAMLTKGRDPKVPANLVANYTWDAAGNLLSEASNRLFEWDHTNRLATFRNQSAPTTAATVYAMYRYDGAGDRVLKIVRKSSGVDEVTLYLGGFERILVGKIGGAATPYDELLLTDHSGGQVCLLRGNPHPDDPFADKSLRYQVGDHLGSVIATLDELGGSLNREEYLPYGETSFGSYVRKRYRFTSKERDSENGMSYHGARYYAPWLARWSSCDPLGPTQKFSLYAYAPSPLRLVDRDGRADSDVVDWNASISVIDSANEAIHDASFAVGSTMMNGVDRAADALGLSNPTARAVTGTSAAVVATAVSSVVEVGVGIIMLGPNMLKGLDAGGREIGEGLGRMVYGEEEGDRILGGLQTLSGLGKGAEVVLEAITMKRGWGTGTIKKAGNSSTVQENNAHGAKFEEHAGSAHATPWIDSADQVTIRPNVGPGVPGTKADNFRIDRMERNALTGRSKLVEFKGTATAPLTKKQIPGFPLFEEFGGEVRGAGGGTVAAHGTQLPASRIQIQRPVDLFLRQILPINALLQAQSK